eukprot:2471663-Rhodomonas_salina.1
MLRSGMQSASTAGERPRRSEESEESEGECQSRRCGLATTQRFASSDAQTLFMDAPTPNMAA